MKVWGRLVESTDMLALFTITLASDLVWSDDFRGFWYWSGARIWCVTQQQDVIAWMGISWGDSILHMASGVLESRNGDKLASTLNVFCVTWECEITDYDGWRCLVAITFLCSLLPFPSSNTSLDNYDLYVYTQPFRRPRFGTITVIHILWGIKD